MENVAPLVLVVNVLWFGMAFRFFGLQPRKAIKILTPASAKAEVSREAFIGGLRFLGGMNLGFAALSAAALAGPLLGQAPQPLTLVFFASAVAHASQLVCNVPFALKGGRKGGAPWDVLSGPMAFIFVVDGICAFGNAIMCSAY